MASTARTSISNMLSQARSTMPAAMRGAVAMPLCTCSSAVLRAPSSSLRYLSTASSSAAAASTSSSSSTSTSTLLQNSSNSERRAAAAAANASLTPKGTQPVRHDPSSALALLRSQPSHYIIASIYQRRFLLTPRDLLTVPQLKDVKVGDVIRLDKIHEVGSRDYTLRASDGQFLKADSVHVRATVVEHTKGKMEETVKFKKRKGYKKTIKNKSKYTRLRIGEIVLGDGQ